jgi:antitoxin component YwqK of YwqJK toxin-antitoxin module
MKNLLFFVAFITTMALAAQAPEPTYKKQGDLVKATLFYDNGAVAQTGFYMAGKLHGEWTMFTKEGNKLAMGSYNLGVKTGKWFFWEGQALKEVDFINNKMAAITQWDNKGTVVLNK